MHNAFHNVEKSVEMGNIHEVAHNMCRAVVRSINLSAGDWKEGTYYPYRVKGKCHLFWEMQRRTTIRPGREANMVILRRFEERVVGCSVCVGKGMGELMWAVHVCVLCTIVMGL